MARSSPFIDVNGDKLLEVVKCYNCRRRWRTSRPGGRRGAKPRLGATSGAYPEFHTSAGVEGFPLDTGCRIRWVLDLPKSSHGPRYSLRDLSGSRARTSTNRILEQREDHLPPI